METRTCEQCGGCGYHYIEWWVVLRYQDCSDWYGPYATHEEAEVKEAEYGRHGDKGCNISVMEKLVKVGQNKPSPGAVKQ